MPSTPNRPLARVLKASILIALLAAIIVTLAPRSAHPPQRVSATAPPPVVYAGPTTDPHADLAAAVGKAQLAAWYEWASNLPVEQPRRRAPVEGNLGAQQAQADGGVWDRIAACESGGNWSINTGNGYYGGLQMDMSFWWSYASRVTVVHEDGSTSEELVAARPDLASKAEQIAAAERARDSGRGYRPWPVCGRRA